MPDFRLIVTGSRDWDDARRIFGALDAVLAQCETEPRQRLVVVHGDCPSGADVIARNWCRIKLGATAADIREERHPADWGTHKLKAGFIRNAEMVAAGAQVCLAFQMPCARPGCRQNPKPHPSHGSEHAAHLAELAGIDVRRFGPVTARANDDNQ